MNLNVPWRRRALLVAAVAAASAACGGPAPDEGSRAGERAPADSAAPSASADLPPDSVFERWARAAFLPDGAGLDSLTAAFGEPDSLVVRTARNEYDSTRVDTLRAAVYRNGLRAEFYDIPSGAEFITSAEIRSDRYLRDRTIRIGMPWEEVLARIGPTRADSGDPLLYWCGSCSEPGRNVVFEVADGRLRAITFGYYTG